MNFQNLCKDSWQTITKGVFFLSHNIYCIFFFLIFRTLAFTWSHYAQHNIIVFHVGIIYLFLLHVPFEVLSYFLWYFFLRIQSKLFSLFLVMFSQLQPSLRKHCQSESQCIERNRKSYHTPVYDDSSCINGKQSNQMVPQVI